MASAPVARSPHFALHALRPEALAAQGALFPHPGTWVGVVLPKRWARRAVTRNLLRRQIYAVTTELAACLPAQALVLRLCRPFAPSQFPSAASTALKRCVRAELHQLLGRVTAQPESP